MSNQTLSDQCAATVLANKRAWTLAHAATGTYLKSTLSERSLAQKATNYMIPLRACLSF